MHRVSAEITEIIRQMNILFLSRDYPPQHVGGVGTYVYEMSRIFAGTGHRVFVITGAAGDPSDYMDAGVHVFRVEVRRSRVLDPLRKKLPGFVERLEYSGAVSRKMREIVPRYHIDIVESCEARAEGFWYYLFRNKPRLVIKLHTPEGIVYALNREPQSRDRRLIEKLEEWWICRAHKIIGLSEAINDLTRRHYRLKLKDIPLVVNPVDSDLFKPGSFSSKADHAVLYVGRLEFRKGVHILVRAMPRVLEKFPQARFILVGDDCAMKSWLLEKINRLGIGDSVEFIGRLPREELAGYYQRSTVCVVPSLWENHPYTILEAMACGTPVIASASGGIPELVKDAVNGVLVAPGSSRALADAIMSLFNDRELRENLGNNARRYIEEAYAPITVARKTLKVYEEITGKGPERHAVASC
jgi:glycosyltransferase involved in cell wall biosynthesis